MVTKLDRLARSLPDVRDIADELTSRGVALSIGGSVYDPHDAVGRLLFNVLGMVSEFEADPIRMRTREGMAIARSKGKFEGKQPTLSPSQRTTIYRELRRGIRHLTAPRPPRNDHGSRPRSDCTHDCTRVSRLDLRLEVSVEHVPVGSGSDPVPKTWAASRPLPFIGARLVPRPASRWPCRMRRAARGGRGRVRRG
jgi:hypothetical protein